LTDLGTDEGKLGKDNDVRRAYNSTIEQAGISAIGQRAALD
jgi:hypothetical protein